MEPESIYAKVKRLAKTMREEMAKNKKSFEHTENLACTLLGAQEFTWKEKEDE
jgi:hypothetical protein